MDTVTTDRSSLPSISDVFSDPYDPDKSFWVHYEIDQNLKERFMEADEHLANGSVKLAKKPLEAIVAHLPPGVRDRYLMRLSYLHQHLRPFKTCVQHFEIPADLKNEFIPAQATDEIRSLNVELPESLSGLMQGTRQESRHLYGFDLLRSEVSVRYQSQLLKMPFRCDNPDDVDSNLLSAMHLDEKKGLTSIVYLSDVGETNGCFSYLEGSDFLKQSLTIRAFHETVSNDLHIRTLEDARQRGIPAALFSTLVYGENLPAEKQAIAKRYLVKHVGPPGTAISFTGNVLLHAGGWPIAGERVALFIAHVGLVRHRAKYLIPYFVHFKLAA
jgi:hypothetical protein